MTTTLAPPTTDTEPPVPNRSDAFTVAVGSAFLTTLVLVASGRSRDGNDLDWAHFGFALAGTIALLGFAIVAYRLVKDPTWRGDLVAWPAALGAIAAGGVVAVWMDDNDATVYLAGAVVVLIAVLAFRLTRRPALVLAGLAGVAMIYVQAFIDVVGDDFEGDNPGLVFGAGVTVFVVLATLLCWRLPGRELTTIVIGAAGIAAQALILFSIMTFAIFSSAFTMSDEDMLPAPSVELSDDPCAELDPFQDSSPSEMPDFDSPEFQAYQECIDEHFEDNVQDQLTDDEYDDGGLYGTGYGSGDNPFENDVWWILGFSLIQCLLWAGLHRLSGHVGFRVLVLAGAVVTIPIALMALMVEDPILWETGLGAAGLGVLAYAAWRARRGTAVSTS
jgi:hypothetical protein